MKLKELYQEQSNILRIILNAFDRANKNITFVGGTAINRLLFKEPFRFSKDLDFYVEGCEDMFYLDDIYGSEENLTQLIDELKKINTEIKAEGFPAGYSLLINNMLRTHLQSDFFIEYQVECDFQDLKIEYEDFDLKLNINSISPLDFLKNKLVKIKDRLYENRIEELNKDLVDIYMLLITFNSFDAQAESLREEIFRKEDELKKHFKESFDNESKKYVFNLDIIPTTYEELIKPLKKAKINSS